MSLMKSVGMGAVTSIVVLLSGQYAFSADICSDAYMTQQIQPYAARAQRATGVCGTAKAGIALYKKSISLVNPCVSDPELRAYKQQLEQLLRDAQEQATSSCG